MIIYELNCGEGHRFEGWFASADDFARQSAAGLLSCPVCGGADVAIVPSAKVAVHKDAPRPAPGPNPPTSGSGASGAAAELMGGLPPEVLRKLREVVRATENVGARFPEEARRIHYAEVPPRAIRGQASPTEAEALREEGIEFTALPAFLTGETH
jgi:hypothetical protein